MKQAEIYFVTLAELTRYRCGLSLLQSLGIYWIVVQCRTREGAPDEGGVHQSIYTPNTAGEDEEIIARDLTPVPGQSMLFEMWEPRLTSVTMRAAHDSCYPKGQDITAFTLDIKPWWSWLPCKLFVNSHVGEVYCFFFLVKGHGYS